MSQLLLSTFRSLAGRTVRAEAGRVVFRAGEPVLRIFLVLSGEVHLVRRPAAGGQLVLQRARAASLLAEASLFSNGYHCDAVVHRPAELFSVRKGDLRRAVESDMQLGIELQRYLAAEIQALRMRAAMLALRTVAERLAAWLAMHKGRLPPKGEWRSLAEELSVSPEALYREIARQRR